MTLPATTADAGRMIGRRYRLRSAVGRGGMGTVWLAEDELLGRAVAVKEVHLPPGLPEPEREELRHRLLREARVAARLDHPSAVTVYDVVEEDGWPYIVMEFVRASTLDEVIRAEGPLPPARVAAIGLEVLGALEAAHAAGIVHRDVKPANIMIRDDGRVTLTDFGIATSSGESSLTSTGLLLGSPSYIAPERARGNSPGPHSDLWSLGATLFTAVEGHAPFERGEPFLTLAAVTSEDHAPFHRAGPLAEVIDGLLARDPADRLDAPAARDLLRAVATAPAAPVAPVPDTTLAEPEPGARSVALPWSDVLAVADNDPASAAYDAEAAAAEVEAPPVPATEVERPAARQDVPPAPAAVVLSAPPAAVEERRTPVLVPVRVAEPEGGRDAGVSPGTLPPAGPSRRPLLGLSLGLLVLLLAAFGVLRYLQGGTASGDDQVAATPTASAPASAPATQDPAAVAGEPVTDAAASEDADSSGQGSGEEDSSGPGTGEDDASDSGGPGSGEETAAPPSEEPAQEAPAPAGVTVPAGFATYTSSEYGWTVRHPPGWEAVRRSATATDLREPGTGRYLRIDTASPPGPSALGDWQSYEPSFAGRHTGYQQLRMEEVDYLDYADAADWEYTYTSGGATLHAINRGFVLNDRSRAYALNFQTREAQWADSRELFDQMAASFQP